ncbi:aminoglycoside adenylyltransferase family protein [Streptomonospora litoralis]|uniref:Streptomycin 3''-adenylyltransferase n=1 Tax=Streptomonospora litoralis TaxID=2498135 RepID=A0A4P6PY59_9ACTN|nr:aminoglycoside adenylyltransferase family protein [Streptomonospora litoralis]QBI52630.1 Streptomycin 3''-adenylyltransferase [Streptomonospora litoralis]
MDQVGRVAQLAGDVLGSDTVGVYLHGSAVLGGLRPASDVDLLAVARRSMDEEQRRRLLDGLLALSGFTGGLRPVELTVVVASRVCPWRFPPTGDFLYGEWLREEFESGRVPRPEPMPDLALLVTLVLAGDRPLVGPPPARVFAPVPHADLVRASVAGVPELLGELDSDTRNAVLTLARIWTTVSTGEVRPKDAAADWALERLPQEHRPVLRHARDLYRNHRYSEETWSGDLRARVHPCAEAVAAAIERLVND